MGYYNGDENKKCCGTCANMFVLMGKRAERYEDHANGFTICCQKQLLDPYKTWVSDDEEVESFLSDNGTDCECFKWRYIHYPIEVSSIDVPKGKYARSARKTNDTGSIVAVQMCTAEHAGETFIGICFGDASMQLLVNYASEDESLLISHWFNPIIYVPALNDIVYGVECNWWVIDARRTTELDPEFANEWAAFEKLLRRG